MKIHTMLCSFFTIHLGLNLCNKGSNKQYGDRGLTGLSPCWHLSLWPHILAKWQHWDYITSICLRLHFALKWGCWHSESQISDSLKAGDLAETEEGRGALRTEDCPRSASIWVSCVFAISHWILDFLDSMILGRNKALLSIKDNFWQCNESLCVLSKCSVFYNIIIYLPYYTSSKQQDRNHTTYSRILISSFPVSTLPP